MKRSAKASANPITQYFKAPTVPEPAEKVSRDSNVDPSLPLSPQTPRIETLNTSSGASHDDACTAPSTSTSQPEHDIAEGEANQLFPLNPHHPPAADIPPQILTREGKPPKHMSFQSSWYDDFPWLHWDQRLGKFLCFYCTQAEIKGLNVILKSKEPQFAKAGYSGNWNHARENFKKHEHSSSHMNCKCHLAIKPGPVSAQLDSALATEQAANRKALMRMVDCIRTCAVNGLALRGHQHKEGNLWALLQLLRKDVPELDTFLNRKGEQFTSWKIQNEIMSLMAQTVTRKLMADINSSPCGFFSVIVDETTDTTGSEQVSISARFVTGDLSPAEVFLGVHDTCFTSGEQLSTIILGVLKQLGLPLGNLRGQCYDGAANMAGIYRGVQSRILQANSKALYIHCVNHSLNLVLQDAAKGITLIRDALQVCNDVGTIISESAQRTALFREISSSLGASSVTIPHPFCQTRWCVRAKALSRIGSQYEATIKTLQEIATTGNPRQGAKAAGTVALLEKASTLLGIRMCSIVFTKVEILATALQNATMTVHGAQLNAGHITEFLRSIRTPEYFHELWETTNREVQNMDLTPPSFPRRRPTHDIPVEDYFRSTFFEFLDFIVTGIENRFQQKSMETLGQLETCLLKKDVSSLPDEYHTDIDIAILSHEYQLFRQPIESVSGAIDLFKALSRDERQLYPEMEKLLRLLLVIPPTSATAERSFSSLRQLLTCLRSSMSQNRLNHVMVLYIHKAIAECLDLKAICREFVFKENRHRVFGEF